MATQWTPSAWFLVTPPQPKPGTIHRRRLDAALESVRDRGQMAVLMAPSGFGKTTALATWAAHTERPVAWLTLTRHDDTAQQVLAGVFNALQRMARETPDLETLLDIVPDPTDLSLMLERMTRALQALPRQVAIVIDDAHLATPALAQDIVAVLSEYSGGNVFVVIAGTHELDGWFNAQLATGVAALLGHEAFAMTEAEISELAELSGPSEPAGPSGQGPGDGESVPTQAILEATDGWPVAIRLMLNAPGTGSGRDETALPDGDLLAEYIARTVLQDLRPELVEFILAVTTCSRVSADLAAALSGREDAAALLNECVRQGLFIDRFVDGDRDPVYRWHEVFARHCRIAAGGAGRERVRELNLIAARWLTAMFPVEATVHAMRAGDPGLAADIIRAHWVPLLIESGAAALNARCLALPDAWARDPEILLIRASCLDVQGDSSTAKMLFARATSVIEAAGETAGETTSEAVGEAGSGPGEPEARPREQLLQTRSFAELFLAHDHPTLAVAADRVREVLHTASLDQKTQTHALFLLGWVELRLRRDPAGAVQLLASAHRSATAAGHHKVARRATQNLMFAYAFGGHFTAARQLAAESESDRDDSQEWQHYDAGIEYVARGLIDFWQNDLVAAEAQFRALIEQGGHDTSYTALARVFFALIAAASGDARLIAEATPHLAGISLTEAHGVPWPVYRAIAAATLAAASGDFPRALAVIEPLNDASSVPVTSVLMAELYRRAGQPSAAMQVLSRIPRREQVSFVRTSVLVTSAVISRHAGDRTRAHRYLEQALDLAVPEGIARPFVASSDDQALRELLTEHAAWGTAHEGFLAARLASTPEGVSRNEVLGVALSRREREILGYLTTTMTAEEIAAALHVSVNTVRTHQRAIYRKLGVNNRREAIKIRI